jgi:tetratricopeptide (TPR) repeat protein
MRIGKTTDLRSALRAAMVAAAILLTGGAGAADTTRFSAQYAEGKKHMDAGRLDDAIRVYGAIIRADPQQDNAYNWRSIAYTRKGMRPQSLEDARRAVQLAPENRVYRFNLGYDLYYASQHALAIEEFDQAEKLGYAQPLLYRYRGASRLALGQYQAAIEDASRAIQLDAADGFSRGVRARAHLRLEKFKEAIEDYSFYLAAHPTDNLSFAEQGYAYHKLGMLEEARKNALTMIEFEPRLKANFDGDRLLDVYDRELRRGKVKELLGTARAAEAAGDWPAAFTAYSAARGWFLGYTAADQSDVKLVTAGIIEAYLKLPSKPPLPEDARRYAVQARTYIGDKRFEDASRSLDRVLSIAPWYPTVHYDKALVSAELKDWSGAIDSMKSYLRLAPQAPDARQVQDKIYEWEARMK